MLGPSLSDGEASQYCYAEFPPGRSSVTAVCLPFFSSDLAYTLELCLPFYQQLHNRHVGTEGNVLSAISAVKTCLEFAESFRSNRSNLSFNQVLLSPKRGSVPKTGQRPWYLMGLLPSFSQSFPSDFFWLYILTSDLVGHPAVVETPRSMNYFYSSLQPGPLATHVILYTWLPTVQQNHMASIILGSYQLHCITEPSSEPARTIVYEGLLLNS